MEITSAFGTVFQISCNDSGDWKISAETVTDSPGIELLQLEFSAVKALPPPETVICWKFPQLDVQARWTPLAGFSKNIPPEWMKAMESNLASGAPVMTFINAAGENQLTYSVSEAMRPVRCGGGVNEEKNLIVCKVTLFSEPESPLNEYQVSIRLDWRNIFYADVIRGVSGWFALFAEYLPGSVPEQAYRPFYSTWYSYHQNLFAEELEKECKLAAEAGFRGVIVDDGWQTDDNNRGYAFCGDWQVSERRFPDMKEHVKKIHALGMKYLLWYGVSVMGFNSKNYPHFAGKTLYDIRRNKTSILDPRFPEVREFLIETYEKALKEWDLDGFKLDFIDCFRFDGVDPAIAENYAGRDIKSLPLAVNKLLSDVITRLKEIKPDILIEFRQEYIGPAVRKYGNMFRAGDCPADIIANRTRIVDLRLFSGNTAVHSDMLEWNMDSPVEVAALQILNVIFSVPQISIRFADLPPEHRKMLQFWLEFIDTHRDILLKGRFMPYHPELNYPLITAENERGKIIAVYQNNLLINAASGAGILYVINASSQSNIVIELTEPPISAAVCDTMGNAAAVPVLTTGLNKVSVPRSGLLKITF